MAFWYRYPDAKSSPGVPWSGNREVMGRGDMVMDAPGEKARQHRFRCRAPGGAGGAGKGGIDGGKVGVADGKDQRIFRRALIPAFGSSSAITAARKASVWPSCTWPSNRA
jgi:hypothetical protein